MFELGQQGDDDDGIVYVGLPASRRESLDCASATMCVSSTTHCRRFVCVCTIHVQSARSLTRVLIRRDSRCQVETHHNIRAQLLAYVFVCMCAYK